MIKPIPKCPSCGVEMKRTGRKNRGEKKPVSIFQCMEQGCGNRKNYNRQGEEMY